MEVQAPPPTCWSNILKQQPPQKPQKKQQPNEFIAQKLVGSCSSTKGIAVAVVDANAIIQGGEKLLHSADRFVSVAEVITEIRDPASRHALHFLPFTVDTLEPSPDALKKVASFARATGDLQTLSDVDLKLIALTYTLEAQIHGTQHLRDNPPAIHAVNVKRLPEKDLPGWGSNVPNLEEWEALDHAEDNGSHADSRILPLKDLSLGAIPEGQVSMEDASSHDGRSCAGNQEDGDGFEKPKRYYPKKKSEVKIDGKKMVAGGIDASLGQSDENSDDWRPAVSRSTHRRFLRRKARRDMSDALSVQQDTLGNPDAENIDDDTCPELVVDENYEQTVNGFCKDGNGNADVSEGINKMKLDEECLMSSQNGERDNLPSQRDEFGGVEAIDSSSQTNEDADTWHTDDISSEQSWTLRSLSESSVACITADYAMQNVLLQMGLRLLAPGGMQIRELHRWVLKCHACSKVTTEIGKIFCPTCGNGGTLRKVAVTVSDNGIILATRRPRVSLRGTKYSLPLPQGGRDAITKNPILREDQLPQKFLYPKTKKKNKQDDDFFIPDDIFLHHNDKKAPLQPPVRKALAVFSGKRNPNDIRYAPRKC
ncbi:RNA-binding NOB1-like protein [Salvia splendens]|uniref:RNA-binding NOB1-like protein n=1 Tax=Salvia splendens TaxID=180675 RepID=UPI001C27969D|nr:RNA-binding NOB1-like protein [Salvia splendens]